MKAKLSYTVRSTRAPGETRDTIVPVIVERLNPVELETVVENCIDRGLIAGLKPTAAHGIAEGVAAQIAREFSKGRGVQFGRCFYGRPYLSGTTDANGRLSSSNGINVRLYKGEDFRLKLDDFSFTFDGAGDSVKVDSVYGDTTDAGGNTYGQLVAGKAYKVRVERTDVNGVTRTLTARRPARTGSSSRALAAARRRTRACGTCSALTCRSTPSIRRCASASRSEDAPPRSPPPSTRRSAPKSQVRG